MVPLDRGIRDLLPLIEIDPEEFVVEEEEIDRLAQGSELDQMPDVKERPLEEAGRLPRQFISHSDEIPFLAQDLSPGSPAAAPQSEPMSGLAASSVSSPAVRVGDIPTYSDATGLDSFSQSASGGHGIGHPQIQSEAGIYDQGNSGVSVRADDAARQGPSDGAPPGEGAAPVSQPAPGELVIPVEGPDGEHDISVAQIADVDQSAKIVVEGYIGPVVARFHIDQDIRMDQDADVDVDLDGSGHFALTIGQRTYINQQTDVDLDIFEEDGVLYVDLFLRDLVEIDQDTTIDFNLFEGFGENDLTIFQDLDMNQDTEVDIAIADDLEDRYIVRVDVAVRQDVDTDHEVDIDVMNRDSGFEVDVQADQVAAIDQETFIKIDFAVV